MKGILQKVLPLKEMKVLLIFRNTLMSLIFCSFVFFFSSFCHVCVFPAFFFFALSDFARLEKIKVSIQ